MGSWGEASFENDNVQNLLDKYFNFNKRTGGRAYNRENVARYLPHIMGDAYDPTALVGVVLGVMEVTQEIPVGEVQRALADAEKALADEDYLKSWTHPVKREKALKAEVKELKAWLKKNPTTISKKDSPLTPAEVKYIKSMYSEESKSRLKNLKNISQLPLGWVALFMENREDQPKEVWPLDHSISEKYLACHGLPKDMKFTAWSKWCDKQNINLT